MQCDIGCLVERPSNVVNTAVSGRRHESEHGRAQIDARLVTSWAAVDDLCLVSGPISACNGDGLPTQGVLVRVATSFGSVGVEDDVRDGDNGVRGSGSPAARAQAGGVICDITGVGGAGSTGT